MMKKICSFLEFSARIILNFFQNLRRCPYQNSPTLIYDRYQSRNKFGMTLSFFSIGFLLSGCVRVFPEPPTPPNLLTLSPAGMSEVMGKAYEGELLIEEPTADTQLNTSKIRIQDFRGKGLPHLTSIKGYEWTERLPVLLQRKLITAFEASGKMDKVGDAQSIFKPERVLGLDLKECHIAYTSNIPVVKITLRAKLYQAPAYDVLATKTFSEEIAASAETVTAFSQAFDQTLGRVFSDLMTWSLSEIYLSRM